MTKSQTADSCTFNHPAAAGRECMRAVVLGIALVLSGCSEGVSETNADDLQFGKAIDTKETGFRLVTNEKASDGCTTTLVGRRLMVTAAHCVAERTPGVATVLGAYRPGSVVRISRPTSRSGKWEDERAFQKFTVAKTRLSPGWKGPNPNYPKDEKTECKGTDCFEFLGHDVAFIAVGEDIPGSVVPLSTKALEEEANVTLYGGGRIAPGASRDDFRLLKGASGIPARSYWITLSKQPNGNAERGANALALIDSGNFVISAGSDAADGAPNLQSGDSGGALVNESGRVVGVNSAVGDGVLNVHARFAGAHAAWIEENVCPDAGKAFDEKSGTCSR
jgi:Trypsin